MTNPINKDLTSKTLFLSGLEEYVEGGKPAAESDVFLKSKQTIAHPGDPMHPLLRRRHRQTLPDIFADMTPAQLEKLGGERFDFFATDMDFTGEGVSIQMRRIIFHQPFLLRLTESFSPTHPISLPQQGIDLYIIPVYNGDIDRNAIAPWQYAHFHSDIPALQPIALFDDVKLEVVYRYEHGRTYSDKYSSVVFAFPHLDRTEWIMAADMTPNEARTLKPHVARVACENMRRIIYQLRAYGLASTRIWPFAINRRTGDVVLTNTLYLALFDAARWRSPRRVGEDEIDIRLPFRHNLTAYRVLTQPDSLPWETDMTEERCADIVMGDKVHRTTDRELRLAAGIDIDRHPRDISLFEKYASHLHRDILESLKMTDYHPSQSLLPIPELVKSRLARAVTMYLDKREPDDKLPAALADDLPEFVETNILIPQVGHHDAYFEIGLRMFMGEDVVHPMSAGILSLHLGNVLKV